MHLEHRGIIRLRMTQEQRQAESDSQAEAFDGHGPVVGKQHASPTFGEALSTPAIFRGKFSM